MKHRAENKQDRIIQIYKSVEILHSAPVDKHGSPWQNSVKSFDFYTAYIQNLKVNSRQKSQHTDCRIRKGMLRQSAAVIWLSRQNLGCHRRSNPGNPWRRSRRFSDGKTQEGKQVGQWWWQEWCDLDAENMQTDRKWTYYSNLLQLLPNLKVRVWVCVILL